MPLTAMDKKREWRRVSTAGQLAAHLRDELARGRWHGTMPGVMRLASDLGAGRDAVEAALNELELGGVLRGQGKGKRRLIVAGGNGDRQRALRVVILLGDSTDRSSSYFIDLIHTLRAAGLEAEFAPKAQSELGHKTARIARMVSDTAADAWVVFAGSRELLQWFASSPAPAFAFAGRANRVPIASIAPDKVVPMRLAIRRLVALGHRKIVLLSRPFRVFPEPGLFERAFLAELESQGIATGAYHLPVFQETAEGFQQSLDSLFRYTPPTAVFINEPPFVAATLQFCMTRGLRVPEDFSLVCTDPDAGFEWCHPSIAHIGWDSGQVIRRIVRWVENVRRGKDDRKKGFFKARFVDGGTIGPCARKASNAF